jgi:signal peptidase I
LQAPSSRAVRETIESIVVAFVLAFLFRTFEAEAFVIPTGSMAPTLQGRHKEVTCANCGFPYRVSASGEIEDEEQVAQRGGARREPQPVDGCTCPNCFYTMNKVTAEHGHPSYSGDRILVSKFAYELDDPNRWDVIVFRFPGDAKMNYIKRLVGLPSETIQLQYGDVYRRPWDAKHPTAHANDPFVIVRKPPAKLRAMLQTVFDNDYPIPQVQAGKWPPRWQAWPPANLRADGTAPAAGKTGGGGWQAVDEGRSFAIDDTSGREAWLRYRHIIPSKHEWQGRDLVPTSEVVPQLISDQYAYNSFRTTSTDKNEEPGLGIHWVGDLAVECELVVDSDAGEVTLKLVEGGDHYHCHIDLSKGKATLSVAKGSSRFDAADGQANEAPTADVKIKGRGKYQVCFANADDQLTLWIGGSPVVFDRPTTYTRQSPLRPVKESELEPGDLAPVGVAARAAKVQVNHLIVLRDVYYIAAETSRDKMITDYDESYFRENVHPGIPRLLSNPTEWTDRNARGQTVFERRAAVTFNIGADQFFPLGDNSPASKDGRLWHAESTYIPNVVDRSLLIGKALYIYWPHALDNIFPFCPNFPRMGFVR